MATGTSAVPFVPSPEKEALLREAVAELRGMGGALMPALQKAQDIYGYLPIEVQKIIAEELSIPLEEVYGVVTFYSQFSLSPKGRFRISVCLGTACYVKGAGQIYDKLKQKFGVEDGACTPDGKYSLEACRCIGACGLAPVLTVNEDVYGRLEDDDLDSIFEKYADA